MTSTRVQILNRSVSTIYFDDRSTLDPSVQLCAATGSEQPRLPNPTTGENTWGGTTISGKGMRICVWSQQPSAGLSPEWVLFQNDNTDPSTIQTQRVGILGGFFSASPLQITWSQDSGFTITDATAFYKQPLFLAAIAVIVLAILLKY